MADPAKAVDQNLLPVQAYFDVYGNFQTFIGQGQPFYASISPIQSGLHITNSTIDSTTIGATTPSSGIFTSISTTTGQISASPVLNNDIANKAYVDSVAQGLNPKGAVKCATTANITLLGLQTIDGYSVLAGNRVLVKNQSNTPDNGIYVAASGAWTRSTDMDVWAEVPGAYTVVTNGSVNGNTSWVSTSAETGTIGVTPITFVQFSGISNYYAGTGLTLSSNTFSITNTGVTAGSYGSASQSLTATVNAQGQLTALSAQAIAISNSQVSGLGTMSTQNASSVAITGGSIDGTTIGATTASTIVGTTITANLQFNGSGAGLTGTASGLSIGGNAATATLATSATTSTNIAGGAANSLVYQTGAGLTGFIATGTGVLQASGSLPAYTTTPTLTGTYFTGIPNGALNNSSITINGNSVALGGSTTVTASTTSTLTIGTGLSGTSFNGSSPVTIAIANTGVTATSYGSASSVGTFTVNAQGQLTAAGTSSIAINGNQITSGVVGLTYGGTGANLTNVPGGVVYGDLSAMAYSAAGTSGQVLTSNGSGAPTWTTPTAYATVTDDTTTNATRYPLFASATSGNLATEYTSSTKYQYNPSTGALSATSFIGSGSSLTSLTAGNLTGTIPSAVLGNSSLYIGTTAIALNRASGSQTLTGTSIDGSAGSATTATTATNANNVAITDDTTTNATVYPTFVASTSGNQAVKTSSTKLKYNPSTGALTASTIYIAP
jgi:hypothetical protein